MEKDKLIQKLLELHRERKQLRQKIMVATSHDQIGGIAKELHCVELTMTGVLDGLERFYDDGIITTAE